MQRPISWPALFAEYLGTLALVFFGGLAVCMVEAYGTRVPMVDNILVALVHGLAIFIMVAALGHISGGHFNPAVTLGVCVAAWNNHPRTQLIKMLGAYIPFQLLGATVGALALAYAAPRELVVFAKFGMPQVASNVSFGGAILVEAILTFFLVIIACGAAMDKHNGLNRVMAPLAIGGAVTVGIIAGGWLSGAAMNPARAFGPAAFSWLMGGEFYPLLAYLIGPTIGGFVAGLLYPNKQSISLS